MDVVRTVLFIGASLTLVELHSTQGGPILINPSQVTSVREPKAINQSHFAPGTKCVLVMGNGNLISVSETCDEVREKLEAE